MWLARLGRPRLALVLAACLLGAAGASAPLPPLVSVCAAGDGLSHVVLVVEHGDGRVLAACVAFSGPTISGFDVLKLSGVEYATAGYAGLGQAVCQLDGEPATYPPGCWTDAGPYWAIFVARAGGAWTVSNLGISAQTFRNGDAEGFRFDPQTGSLAPPSAAGRCPPTPGPTASPTPARTPTRTPSPVAVAPTSATPRASHAVAGPTPPTAAQTAASTVSPEPSSSGLAHVPPSSTAAAGASNAAFAGSVPSGLKPAPADATAPSMAPAGPAWVALGLAALLLATLGLGALRRRTVR